MSVLYYVNLEQLYLKDMLAFVVYKNLLHSLGLVYKSMRGMVTNSIDRDQWLNVTSESRDRIEPSFFLISPWVGIEPATLASLSRNGLP
jgi:hypothetical protein